MKLPRAALFCVLLAFVGATFGCPVSGEIMGDACEHPDWYHHGPDGQLDQCHCEDPPNSPARRAVGKLLDPQVCDCVELGVIQPCYHPDAGVDDGGPTLGCTGQCLPIQPVGWETPVLLWVGAEPSAPPCPESAPVIGYEGHADLDVPATACAACACGPPAGSCGPPTALTASTSACADKTMGAVLTAFSPPVAGWDGACTDYDAIAASDCAASSCTRSLTIAPLAVYDGDCAPIEPAAPESTPTSWKTYARACVGSADGSCASSSVCAAAPASLPDGFLECIFHDGDVDCPASSAYTRKQVVYAGFTDTRSCTPCGCGTPAGSTCSALISAYTDAACSALLVSETVGSEAPACVDVLAGSALGSKSASLPTYIPGVCQPTGGEPAGSAEPTMAATFCCLPR